MAGEADAFLLLILAFIFPPAAVAFVAGCGADLCLNILLTILGYLPGCLHAFWLILRRTEANERYGYKNWTYAGMGEYAPTSAQPVRPPSASYYSRAPPPPPMGPPPGQYPAGGAQASVDQKAGYAPPPASAEGKSGGDQGSNQKTSGYPPPSAEQKYASGEDQPPQPAPVDQKQADPVAQSTVPASGT